MAYKPKDIIDATLLTTAVTTLYTVPDNTTCIVRQIALTNIWTLPATFTLYFVKHGAVAADVHVIGPKARTISKGRDYVVAAAAGQVLNAGDFIAAVASASGYLSIRAAGVEFI